MADDLKPAYLLAGSDRPKVDRALQRLRSRFAPDAVELHTAAEAVEDIVRRRTPWPLRGRRRLIVVDGVEAWRPTTPRRSRLPQGAAPGDRARPRRDELKRTRRSPRRLRHRRASGLEGRQGSRQTWVAEQFQLHGAKAEPERAAH
jgi:hypothetical protein